MNFDCKLDCKLEILNDTEAVYDYPYYDEDDKYCGEAKVKAKIGGDDLMLLTVKCLNHWVDKYDHLIRREELKILGRHLYNIAFCTPNNVTPGSVDDPLPLKTAFEKTYQSFERMKSGSDDRLRIMLVLRKEAKELLAFPWEFIFMPKGDDGVFLAGEQTDLILARFVPDIKRTFQPDRESKKLRILIVLSAPEELGTIYAEELIAQLKGLESPQIAVERLDQPTTTTFMETITRFKPHIMHFIGHGKKGKLALLKDKRFIKEAKAEISAGLTQNRIKDAHWLESSSVRGLFADHEPPLVFLHACEGAAQDLLPISLKSFRDTARELAYSSIPAVVAMQYKITNYDANLFAQEFYGQIREGKHIDEAVVEARCKLGRSTGDVGQFWGNRNFGTPVIYLRSEKPIIQPPLSEPRGPAPGGTPPVTMQKVPCPYPNCLDGWVSPDDKFCAACGQPLMPCPSCKLVMAQLRGICGKCGNKIGTGSLSAQAVAPQSAASAAPTQLAQAPDRFGIVVADEHQTRTE